MLFPSLTALLFVGTANLRAAPILMGPSPYLQFADSPFFGGSFSYFHLENFEDHLFNTPGVTASAGGVTSVVFGPLIHDSVDADDGAIDGSGLLGDSFFNGCGSCGVTFTFNAAVLGSLPTHVGIVWTDGAGSTTFRAFGPGNVLLGQIGPVLIADGTHAGTTGEDRFFGVIDPDGISSIFIRNGSGGIEVDHLQYGLLAPEPAPVPIPEPASLALLGTRLAAVSVWLRKRKA